MIKVALIAHGLACAWGGEGYVTCCSLCKIVDRVELLPLYQSSLKHIQGTF